jgi:hypothetical protein
LLVLFAQVTKEAFVRTYLLRYFVAQSGFLCILAECIVDTRAKGW